MGTVKQAIADFKWLANMANALEIIQNNLELLELHEEEITVSWPRNILYITCAPEPFVIPEGVLELAVRNHNIHNPNDQIETSLQLNHTHLMHIIHSHIQQYCYNNIEGCSIYPRDKSIIKVAQILYIGSYIKKWLDNPTVGVYPSSRTTFLPQGIDGSISVEVSISLMEEGKDDWSWTVKGTLSIIVPEVSVKDGLETEEKANEETTEPPTSST